MAKAKQVPDIDHFGDPHDWVAEILLLRFDEAASFAGAALVPENVNGVHDMRVALRRLRSAIRDFGEVIDEKPIKQVSKELKKIARALGVVRDLDVAIIAIEELSAETEDTTIKTGIEVLAGNLRTERDRAHLRLERSLSVQSIGELRERFTTAINERLRQPNLFRASSLRETGADVIEGRLKELLDLGNAIYVPSDGTKLHELRIAAKRLRYAIELFAAAWNDETLLFAKSLSKLQGFLGEVHDCDVWTEKLSERLIRMRDQTFADPEKAAAAWLLPRFVDKRSNEYCRALELWREWQTDAFADRLRAAIRQE